MVPQDERTLQVPPERLNRPPRIIESLVEPVDRTVVVGGGNGCRVDFIASVEDLDVDDLLTVNFYIDYDANSNPSFYGQQRRLTNNGSAVRPDTANLSIDLSTLGADNPLTVGTHLVEVLVSDGQLINRSPQPRQLGPDGQTDNTYVAVWSWLVRVEPGCS